MTKIEKASTFSRRTLLQAGGAFVVSVGMPIGLDTVLGINQAQGARRAPAAHPRPALLLHRGQCGRLGLRLLRQDRFGARALHRHRPDRGRGARRSVQARHRDHGQYRHQREPGRRLGLDRHPAGRQADAHGGRGSAPRAGRDGGRQARRAGRQAHRHRRRDQRRHQQDHLRGADRRALLQRHARLEQGVRQHPLRARQGPAQEAERVQDRRPAAQARGHRAESLLPGGLRHRREGARHGARPHDPAAGRGRQPGAASTRARSRTSRASRSCTRRTSSASSPTPSGTPSRRPSCSRSNGRSRSRRSSTMPARSTTTSARRRCASARWRSRTATWTRPSRPPRG